MRNLIKKLIGRDRTAGQVGTNEGDGLPSPLGFANASSVQLIVHNAAQRETTAHRDFLKNCTDHSAAENWLIARGNLDRTKTWASQRTQQKDRPAAKAASL